MIIPIRCMNCGKILADKWEYYQTQLKARKGDSYGTRTYFDGKPITNTIEHDIMLELGLTRYCCRKVLLTHIDIIQRI